MSAPDERQVVFSGRLRLLEADARGVLALIHAVIGLQANAEAEQLLRDCEQSIGSLNHYLLRLRDWKALDDKRAATPPGATGA